MLLAWFVPALAGALINEVVYDPADSDGNNEWIELCHDGGATISLAGWTLEAGGASFGVCYEFTGGTLAAGEYLVIGGGGVADVLTDFGNASSGGLQNGGSESDGIRLVDPDGDVVDTLIYDGPNSNGLPDDRGRTTDAPYAVDVSAGHSLGRWPDCTDSDDAGADFVDYEVPSPGAPNADPGGDDTGDPGDDTGDPVGPADCAGADGVRVNEFATATGVEWVELYNAGSGTVALEGWELAYALSGDYDTVALPAASLPAGGWVVIGSPGAPVRDIELALDLGNSKGALQIRCDGAALDTVVYGSENSGGYTEDDGTVATSLAPAPGTATSVGRVPDGVDTDVSGADFQVIDPPTPGAGGPRCEPGATTVKVNELYFDPPSTDDGNEWVELYNAGSTELVLDGYALQTATSTWGTDYTFPAGTTLAPGAFLVIGGTGVAEADVVAESLSLGNASTSGDGVRLLDCEGAPVDVVLYGEGAAEAELTADGGFTGLAAAVAEYALGRAEDGVDTDDAADWRALAVPTPGAPNDAGGDGDDTGDSPKPGGCGGGRPDAGRPDGAGCATVLPLGGWEALALALAAARRRRR